jgi:hypothetical protein
MVRHLFFKRLELQRALERAAPGEAQFGAKKFENFAPLFLGRHACVMWRRGKVFKSRH